MSPKISIVAKTLDHGAHEVRTIGHVLSASGHRLIALPVPVGLPSEVPGQLAEINRDLQHAGRVLEQQKVWLRQRYDLALKADRLTVGGEIENPQPLYSTDPTVVLPKPAVAIAAGAAAGGPPTAGHGSWQGNDEHHKKAPEHKAKKRQPDTGATNPSPNPGAEQPADPPEDEPPADPSQDEFPAEPPADDPPADEPPVDPGEED